MCIFYYIKWMATPSRQKYYYITNTILRFIHNYFILLGSSFKIYPTSLILQKMGLIKAWKLSKVTNYQASNIVELEPWSYWISSPCSPQYNCIWRKEKYRIQSWWFMPALPAFGRQNNFKFKIIGYTENINQPRPPSKDINKK